MSLVDVWFIVIAFLWTGFFVLEGFDFGVGMLQRLMGRDDAERRQIMATIGPVWDADEVWLVTGGIAIFAAFPLWYATAFSAAYVPLLLVIAAIIVRGIAVEYRSKRESLRWRSAWDNAMFASSLLLPLLFGIFWSGLVHGLPLDSQSDFVGRSLLSFIHPYSILGGLALLSFALAQGATFIALKTVGDVQSRASRLALPLTGITAILMAAFCLWTWAAYSRNDTVALVVAIVAVVSLLAAMAAHARDRHLVAFWLNAVAALTYVASMFIALYPNAIPTTSEGGASLTLEAAAASQSSLHIITVIACVGVPLVIGYQAWSFWVFRKRISKPVAATSE